MSLPPDSSSRVGDTYAGEPGRPDPWATKDPREGLRDTDEARVVSLSPDVCLTPRGGSPVPVPYPIVDYCGHDNAYANSVRFTQLRAMVLRSNTTHVHGDKPGTAGGVKSGTVGDITEPIGHAPQVRAEGSPVIRHLDRFWMNKRNTVGEAQFARDQNTKTPPDEDDPVPGSLRRFSDEDIRAMAKNAQYAQLAQPAPAPVSPPSSPPSVPTSPGPAANDNVFKPSQPPAAPPEPTPSIGARLGRWSVWGLTLMLGGDTPLVPFPARDADPTERAINTRARAALSMDHANNEKVKSWYYNEMDRYHKHSEEMAKQSKVIPLPQGNQTYPSNVRVTQNEKDCLALKKKIIEMSVRKRPGPQQGTQGIKERFNDQYFGRRSPAPAGSKGADNWDIHDKIIDKQQDDLRKNLKNYHRANCDKVLKENKLKENQKKDAEYWSNQKPPDASEYKGPEVPNPPRLPYMPKK